MEIFNAANLGFIMGGFGNTIVISALAIVFSIAFGTVLALVKQYAVKPLSLLVSA